MIAVYNNNNNNPLLSVGVCVFAGRLKVREHPEMKGEEHNTTKVGASLLGLCNIKSPRSFSLYYICAVERRRRDKINNWIVTLSKIIPDCSVDSRTGAVSRRGDEGQVY